MAYIRYQNGLEYLIKDGRAQMSNGMILINKAMLQTGLKHFGASK